MGYHITGEVIKLNIKVPQASAMEVLNICPDYDAASISSNGITLNIDEQTEGDVVPLSKGYYTFNKETVPHLGGNKSLAEEFFTELAKKFEGDFEARFTGEDGETWAVKIVKGVEKKVKVIIVEE